MNFIKKIYEKKIDDFTHKKFVRFSVGEFERELFIVSKGKKDFKVWAGFEYVDVLLRFVAELIENSVEVNGVIVTKDDILLVLDRYGIEPIKKTGKKYTIKTKLDNDQFKALVDELYMNAFVLLNVRSSDIKVSVKQSVPKPDKRIEKFITVTFANKFWDKFKDEFLFDIDEDFKKLEIKHVYYVNDIIVDEDLLDKDPLKARLTAIRKGKIVREINKDGSVSVVEFEFEV